MRNIRISLLMVVFTLIAVGIVMIYSSTAIYSWEKFNDSAYFLKRHLIFLSIGFILSAIVMMIDYRVFRGYSKIFIIAAVFLLALLQVPGMAREISGAKRWFQVFGFSFQPSEFASLAVIIYTAGFLSRRQARERLKYFFAGVFPPVVVLGLVSVLILAQPDLGTVVAVGFIVFIMLICAEAKANHLLAIIVSGMPFFYFLIFNVPYRRKRIMSFLNPWADPLGAGFQLIQSQVAIGSGGLFGKGLGKSLQKLFYLPAAHTDFIYSIIIEELGFFAGLAVIVLFILFFVNGIKIAKRAQDSFGIFLSLGITALISVKAIINICVSMGAFPTKGLPLPFISYGGSALIFDMICVALLLNIARFGENA